MRSSRVMARYPCGGEFSGDRKRCYHSRRLRAFGPPPEGGTKRLLPPGACARFDGQKENPPVHSRAANPRKLLTGFSLDATTKGSPRRHDSLRSKYTVRERSRSPKDYVHRHHWTGIVRSAVCGQCAGTRAAALFRRRWRSSCPSVVQAAGRFWSLTWGQRRQAGARTSDAMSRTCVVSTAKHDEG